MLCHALVKLLFRLSYIEVCILFAALHCIHNTTQFVFVVFFFFGWTSFCLRMFLSFKCTGMSCLEKILLSFSETADTYGITVCLRQFFLAFLPVWFGPFDFADLTNVQFGYPQVWRAFLEGWCSFCFPSALVGILSARWWRVMMTASLCSRGWSESKSMEANLYHNSN